MKRNTAVIHAKQFHDPVHGSHVSPIYQTSTYVLPDFDTAVYLNQHVDEGFVYSRFGSPSVREFEEKIAYLEKSKATISPGFTAVTVLPIATTVWIFLYPSWRASVVIILPTTLFGKSSLIAVTKIPLKIGLIFFRFILSIIY